MSSASVLSCTRQSFSASALHAKPCQNLAKWSSTRPSVPILASQRCRTCNQSSISLPSCCNPVSLHCGFIISIRKTSFRRSFEKQDPLKGRDSLVPQAKAGDDQETQREERENGGSGKENGDTTFDSKEKVTAAVTAAVVAEEPSAKALEAAAKAAATEDQVVGRLKEGPAISPALQALYDQCQTWRWKGQYKTNYVKIGNGPPIVLIHGFGASLGHWRKNIPVLAKTHTVYALDMIGYGRSDKPAGFVYTMETWAEQLQDFLREVVRSPAVLMGNSLGSLTALIAAAEGGSELVKACILVNCAGGMNNKAIADDWRVAMLLPVFWFIDFLLAQEKLAGSIFNRVRNNQNIQTVLRSVYVNEDAVDRELVEIISQPAGDEGALHAFCSILSGPPGPRPEKLIPRISSPILLVWGDTDTFIPLDGPIGRFFTALPKTYPNIEMTVIKGGHCPHDDMHELFHDAVVPWLGKVSTETGMLAQT